MVDAIAKILKRVDRLLIFTVVIPTLLSALYFGLVASDVYQSESNFVVRSPDKGQPSGLGILLNTAGFSNATSEASAVEEYVRSRDSLRELNRDQLATKAFTRPEVSTFDRFDGMVSGDTAEQLFQFYEGKVHIDRDSATGITRLKVKAFTPEDAHAINLRLLEQSERLVNRLSARGRQDLIAFAQGEVDEAKAKSLQAALALSAYRNRVGVVDPEKQATVQLQMISKLQDELIATRTQLQQLRTFTPKNPQIPVLQKRLEEISGSIEEETRKVAGGSRSLAASAVQYQQLQLESQFSDKRLGSALASLQDAQNEARRKQAYVERISQPSLPDYPYEPRRLRGLLATLILGLVAYGIARMLLAGMREHQL